MPIPQYQRQQKADEARGALKRLVPELQPQTAPGGLAKTQWEIDNGYPHGYSWEYIPLHLAEDAADMESSPIPEELRTQKSYRLTALRHGILQRQDARAAGPCAQTPETSRASSPLSKLKVTGQVPQNPGFIRQFAELGCCSQPEAPRAVEEEPEQSLPEDLKPAEGLEPETNVVVSKGTKRGRPSQKEKPAKPKAPKAPKVPKAPKAPKSPKAGPSQRKKPTPKKQQQQQEQQQQQQEQQQQQQEQQQQQQEQQ
ncbi:hypothetical protein TrVFT333_010535 [Trichoderma virens FT-333]|nr:hypothetical protein TrVFT333_010535 [Trichoderma virens FT-333]